MENKAAYLTVRCPYCGARPGVDCRAITGRVVPPHMLRFVASNAPSGQEG